MYRYLSDTLLYQVIQFGNQINSGSHYACMHNVIHLTFYVCFGVICVLLMVINLYSVGRQLHLPDHGVLQRRRSESLHPESTHTLRVPGQEVSTTAR